MKEIECSDHAAIYFIIIIIIVIIIIIIIIIIRGVKLLYLPADAVQYHFSRDWQLCSNYFLLLFNLVTESSLLSDLWHLNYDAANNLCNHLNHGGTSTRRAWRILGLDFKILKEDLDTFSSWRRSNKPYGGTSQSFRWCPAQANFQRVYSGLVLNWQKRCGRELLSRLVSIKFCQSVLR